MYDLLNNCQWVVLLGVSNNIKPIIRSLNRDYSISPIVYSNTRPFHKFNIFLKYKFIRQAFPNNNYYTVRSILDISEFTDGHTCLIVPMTSQFNNIVQESKDLFENKYIIIAPSKLIDALPSYRHYA